MSDTAAIVLAAGLSRRMGAANKLLLSVGDDVLVRTVVLACAAVTDHPVTVVTGHQSDLIKDVLHGYPVVFVHNPDFEDGQMTSVDAGLRSAPEAETCLIALGDQPRITASCLTELLETHHEQARGRITIPMVDGSRGNPIVVPADQRTLMLADPVNLGCRKLTRTAPELVHEYDTLDVSFVVDIDTPADLALVRAELPPHTEKRQ